MNSERKYLKKLKRFLNPIIFLLAISVFFLWEGILNFQRVPLRIDFLDIGQGDATLITTSDNLQVLVDAGPGKKILSELGEVMPLLDRTIDVVIITHPDKDHIEGLEFLLQSYSIDTVILGKVDSESTIYSDILDELRVQGIKTLSIDDTTDIKLGDININIIWPKKDTDTFLFNEINNTSYSMVVSYEEFDALITGDLYAEYENKMLPEIAQYEAIEVYKAGHHGSQTSSSNELLSKLNSEIAVISSGENNSYGHPHKEVLDRFNKYDLDVFRTDSQGRISISVVDGSFKVNSETSESKTYKL